MNIFFQATFNKFGFATPIGKVDNIFKSTTTAVVGVFLHIVSKQTRKAMKFHYWKYRDAMYSIPSKMTCLSSKNTCFPCGLLAVMWVWWPRKEYLQYTCSHVSFNLQRNKNMSDFKAWLTVYDKFLLDHGLSWTWDSIWQTSESESNSPLSLWILFLNEAAVGAVLKSQCFQT